jgi:predicted nucleic acid-binding protein
MMTPFSHVFIDTNVLIYHTFSLFDDIKHRAVKARFAEFESSNTVLYISRQVLREFFAISTNPKFFDEPLTTAEACEMMLAFNQTFVVLEDAPLSLLSDLLLKYNISRQKVHDTNLVATMIHAGIFQLYSFNIKDFKGFSEITCLSIE